MKLFEDITTWLRERNLRRRLRSPGYPAGSLAANGARPVPTLLSPLEEFGQRLGERLRLATDIADDAARCEIESYCGIETLGTRDWYDTLAVSPKGPEYERGVDRALRYLDLRGHMQRHPVQKHLVRFAR